MTAAPTVFTAELADRLLSFTAVAAAQADVKAAVEANHDENRWWPTRITDWRMRMAVAGWSSRVSYTMIGTYAAVVKTASAHGWDALTNMSDAELAAFVTPLGLITARIRYLRSLAEFLADPGGDPLTMPAGQLIASLAARVNGASFKVAQCAALYARGYHCGIIPVDSGMVRRLAPCRHHAGTRPRRAPADAAAAGNLRGSRRQQVPGHDRRLRIPGDHPR